MVREKTSYRALVILSISILLLPVFLQFSLEISSAADPEAENSELKSVIEGVKVIPLGSDKIVLEFRGTKMTQPVPVDVHGAAIALDWGNIRFPRDTDKKDWWDEYGWSVIRINPKKSYDWWQKYDYMLVQRLQAVSNDKNGVRILVTGEKPLKVIKITGMTGSDTITIELQAENDIVPPQPVLPKQHGANDPLGMNSPVTMELREVSVRDVFRMLADLRHLNLVIDPSVPDNLMTFSFKHAKFSEVFAYMLRMNDLMYSMMGNTLVIGTNESIGRTLGKNTTKEYKIAYGDITKLPALIMSVVTLPKPPVADERRRVLYITASPEQHVQVEALLNRVDHPGKQVMLEARLLEINDEADQEFDTMINAVYNGWLFSYSGANGLSTEYTDGNVKPNITETLATTVMTQGKFPITGNSISDSYNPLNIADKTMHLLDAGIKALETKNKGRVLANPSVVVIDGQKSTIKLTHNYLYQSGVDDNGNPEFSEQETGPTVELTPFVGRDGFVTLKLKISTGEIVQFRKSGDSEAPETTKREVDTQIRVRDGELFVIGGLHQDNKSKYISRVPILGYIPLIGQLFTSRTDKHTKSQMAFIVVPHILDIPTGTMEKYGMPQGSLMQ